MIVSLSQFAFVILNALLKICSKSNKIIFMGPTRSKLSLSGCSQMNGRPHVVVLTCCRSAVDGAGTVAPASVYAAVRLEAGRCLQLRHHRSRNRLPPSSLLHRQLCAKTRRFAALVVLLHEDIDLLDTCDDTQINDMQLL